MRRRMNQNQNQNEKRGIMEKRIIRKMQFSRFVPWCGESFYFNSILRGFMEKNIIHDFRLYQKYTKFKCPLVQDKFVNHPAGVPDF